MALSPLYTSDGSPLQTSDGDQIYVTADGPGETVRLTQLPIMAVYGFSVLQPFAESRAWLTPAPRCDD